MDQIRTSVLRGHFCASPQPAPLLFNQLPPLYFKKGKQQTKPALHGGGSLGSADVRQINTWMVSEAVTGFLEADWQIGVTEDGLSGRANLKQDLLIYFHTATRDDHKRTKYVCRSASGHNFRVFVFLMSPSDGLVVVGVHSAKFPNEKVRLVGFVCTFPLCFCNWRVSIHSYRFLFVFSVFSENAPKFKTILWQQGSFSEAIKYCRFKNNKHKNVKYLKILIYLPKIQQSCPQ